MLDFGDICLLRYRYPDGRIQAALPMRIVLDEPLRTVAWLASGTPIRYWAAPGGGDPRDLDLEQRFRVELTNADRRWTGPGVLHVMVPGRPYQVVHFWHDDGTFRHWYVNLESPVVRAGARLDAVDWHLDLVIDADRNAVWKDEDEARAAVGTSYLRSDDLERARSAGARVLADLDRWPDRAIGDWRAFQPDPTWTVPDLPTDWAGDVWSAQRLRSGPGNH